MAHKQSYKFGNKELRIYEKSILICGHNIFFNCLLDEKKISDLVDVFNTIYEQGKKDKLKQIKNVLEL